MQDFQYNRLILKNSNLYKFFKKKYPTSRILCWNFWFIIIHMEKSRDVEKYYINKDFYFRELRNYQIYNKNGFLIPNFEEKWEINILDEKLYLIKFQNIRYFYPNFSSYNDMNNSDFSYILSSIHSINNKDLPLVFNHWNPHFSNFFLDENLNLWIFDLVSSSVIDLEYDFSSIYFYSDYDDKLINNLIWDYKYKSYFSYKRFYYYLINKIKQNIDNSDYLSKSIINKYKKDLVFFIAKYNKYK